MNTLHCHHRLRHSATYITISSPSVIVSGVSGPRITGLLAAIRDSLNMPKKVKHTDHAFHGPTALRLAPWNHPHSPQTHPQRFMLLLSLLRHDDQQTAMQATTLISTWVASSQPTAPTAPLFLLPRPSSVPRRQLTPSHPGSPGSRRRSTAWWRKCTSTAASLSALRTRRWRATCDGWRSSECHVAVHADSPCSCRPS